jgi:hypothetical protein
MPHQTFRMGDGILLGFGGFLTSSVMTAPYSEALI